VCSLFIYSFFFYICEVIPRGAQPQEARVLHEGAPGGRGSGGSCRPGGHVVTELCIVTFSLERLNIM
jgi:hypothetical protein